MQFAIKDIAALDEGNFEPMEIEGLFYCKDTRRLAVLYGQNMMILDLPNAQAEQAPAPDRLMIHAAQARKQRQQKPTKAINMADYRKRREESC